MTEKFNPERARQQAIEMLKKQLAKLAAYTEQNSIRSATIPLSSTGVDQTYNACLSLGINFVNCTCTRDSDGSSFTVTWPSDLNDLKFRIGE